MSKLPALVLAGLLGCLHVSAEAQRAGPPAPHIEVKTIERPSSGRALDLGDKRAGESANSIYSPLVRSALTGQLVDRTTLLQAAAYGDEIFRSDFKEAERLSRFPINELKFELSRSETAKETWNERFIRALVKEAGPRGFALFSGGWSSDGSLISMFRPEYDEFKYAFVKKAQVSDATLYIPYSVAFGDPFQRTEHPLKKGDAPLVVVDRDLFAEATMEGVHHRELLFDPRLDLKTYWRTESGTLKTTPIESRQLEFDVSSTEPATMRRLLGCCVYVRPPVYGEDFAKFLRLVRFDSTRVRVALMVHDSATRSAMQADIFLSSGGRSQAIGRNVSDIDSWLTAQIKGAAGGTMLLLAHVEKRDYVVRDSSGTEVGRIPVRRANELALTHGVTLFNLGCKTASALHDFDGIGVFEAFNSVRMLRTISDSLRSHPKSIADFLERLGTPEAKIVIPASLIGKDGTDSLLAELRNGHVRAVVDRKALRIPAIELVVSPSATIRSNPSTLSVYLTSGRRNQRGTYPVIAELQVVLNPCSMLEAAKKVGWEAKQGISCTQVRTEAALPVRTYLYGNPERAFR